MNKIRNQKPNLSQQKILCNCSGVKIDEGKSGKFSKGYFVIGLRQMVKLEMEAKNKKFCFFFWQIDTFKKLRRNK